METATYLALKALVSTIENTGGVKSYADGTYAPAADLDWIDLGDAYMLACSALSVNPLITDDE